MKRFKEVLRNSDGKVRVKVFWVASIVISLVLTIILNVVLFFIFNG